MRRSALLALGTLGAGLPLLLAAQAPVHKASGLQLRPNPQATVISGSATGPLLYVNNAASSALNVFGVLGSVSSGPYGIGLLGYGSNASSGNIGVVGLDTGPGGYGTIGYSNYSASGAANASTQTTGLYGISLYGSGVVGQTQSTTFSTAGTLAGVAGIDNTNVGGINDGVFGKTTSGGWGVEAQSSDDAYGGALGNATTGIGVKGSATSGTGVAASATTGTGLVASNNSGTNPAMSVTAYGASDALDVVAGSIFGIKVTDNSFDDAIYSTSSSADGVYGFTAGDEYAGVLGQSLQANDSGCAPTCAGSSGVIGSTDAYNDGFGDYEAGVFGNGFFAVLGYPASAGSYSFVGTDVSGNGVITINAAGNIVTNGTVTSAGATTTINPTSHGYYAQSYGTQAMSRILEDENSAGIVNGAGVVHIDPAFTEAVGSGTYQVFLTPKGDCNGLYVTDETPASFVVREIHGGRSTLAFDYRIVAHPYGHSAERMALASSMSAFQPGASVLQRGHASLKGLLAHIAAEKSADAALTTRRLASQKAYVKHASPAQGRFSLPSVDLSRIANH